MQSFLNSLTSLFSSYITQLGTQTIVGISTNTRTLKSGELFIALNGENFNGHNFIETILDKVSAIAISEPIDIDIPDHITIFTVSDTLIFYQLIATEYLKTKPKLKRIGITGSAGKTSTKEWLALLLSHKYKTFKTFGNLNNLVGVPASALEVTDEDIAIFEIGTGKPGDIKILRDIIQPNIVIVTSIGAAHLEFFGDIENIAKEKASIAIPKSQCYAPINIPFQETIFKDYTIINPQKVFTQIKNQNEKGFELTFANENFTFPFFGEYNLKNFALAVYIALSLDISSKQITSITFLPLPSYRSKTITKNKAKLILDCYNANPLSMMESLKSIHSFDPKPILVLGDMLELGEKSLELHRELGEFLNTLDFSIIFFIGEQMQQAHLAYTKTSLYGKTLSCIKPLIIDYFEQEVTIFVKGSRGMYLEDIETF